MLKPFHPDLAVGYYIDEQGTIHIDIPEILRAMQLLDTPENRDYVTYILANAITELSPTTEIIEKP